MDPKVQSIMKGYATLDPTCNLNMRTDNNQEMPQDSIETDVKHRMDILKNTKDRTENYMNQLTSEQCVLILRSGSGLLPIREICYIYLGSRRFFRKEYISGSHKYLIVEWEDQENIKYTEALKNIFRTKF